MMVSFNFFVLFLFLAEELFYCLMNNVLPLQQIILPVLDTHKMPACSITPASIF
jgi:hypothetical protein